MSKLNLLLFLLGVGVFLYGVYAMIASGQNSSFIFIFGGIVITAIAAGLIGKNHKEGNGDAG